MVKAPATHTEWVPHAYQVRAVDHLTSRWCAALFLDPGLGKTSITLEAFRQLKEQGMAKKMLVVAPLRVCQLVWRQEGEQWTQFRGLTFSLLHGPKKDARFAEDTDIHIINPEGIPWLVKKLTGKRMPYDTVVLDELTKFKNASAKRHKLLRPLMGQVKRRWGLTGTPIPNGYMDLFGQILILDDGRALGKYITHYRDRFFNPGYNGFDYLLRRGADKEIEDKISPYVLRMSAEDYLTLPQLVQDVRKIVLPPKERKLYEELKREMLVELDGEILTAAQAGARHSKLKQLANGAVYMGEGEQRRFVEVHDLKLDALEELIEELAGKPLLIGYEFNHDLARIRKRLEPKYGKIPDLKDCKTDAKIQEFERAWNAGEYPIASAHPASAAHGLNFQKGNACHLCWFSVTVDLELYEQFLRRLLRQGNKSDRVINHALLVAATADNDSIDTLAGKALTQDTMLARLKGDADEEEFDMAIRKLGKKGDAAEEKSSPAKGWGKKAEAVETPEVEAEEKPKAAAGWGAAAKAPTQRDEIHEKLTDDKDVDDTEAAPKSLFSKETMSVGTGDTDAAPLQQDDEAESEEKPKRKRTTKAQKEADAFAEEVRAEFHTLRNQIQELLCVPKAPTELSEEQKARQRKMEQRYIREQSLNTTVTLVTGFPDLQEALDGPEDIVDIAKMFEDYIKGDLYDEETG